MWRTAEPPPQERCSRCQDRSRPKCPISAQTLPKFPTKLPTRSPQAQTQARSRAGSRTKIKPRTRNVLQKNPPRSKTTKILARPPRASEEGKEKKPSDGASRNAAKRPRTRKPVRIAYYARRVLQLGAMQKLRAKAQSGKTKHKMPRLHRNMAGIEGKGISPMLKSLTSFAIVILMLPMRHTRNSKSPASS